MREYLVVPVTAYNGWKSRFDKYGNPFFGARVVKASSKEDAARRVAASDEATTWAGQTRHLMVFDMRGAGMFESYTTVTTQSSEMWEEELKGLNDRKEC